MYINYPKSVNLQFVKTKKKKKRTYRYLLYTIKIDLHRR